MDLAWQGVAGGAEPDMAWLSQPEPDTKWRDTAGVEQRGWSEQDPDGQDETRQCRRVEPR